MGHEIAPRTSIHRAVILQSRDAQEFRVVTLFTAEEGVLEAFLFGGSKSKLKSLASPFHSGTAWLYREPGRDTGKLTDFEIREGFPGLRESLAKTWTASLWAEVAMKTHGGGSHFETAEALLETALLALERAKEADSAYASILYLWRVLDHLGLKPDLSACLACGNPFRSDENVSLAADVSGFHCASCMRDLGDEFSCREPSPDRPFVMTCPVLSPGARRYLDVTGAKDFHAALNVRLDAQGLASVKETVYSVISSTCEGGLKTLLGGSGIL